MIAPGERKYVAVLVAVLVAVVAAEWLAPAPLDWTPSYEHEDARPYAAQVLHDVLPHVVPSRTVVEAPPFVHLADTAVRGGTYFFLTEAFAPDAAEADRLLRFAARGHTVFVAARAIEGLFADTLGVRTERAVVPDSLQLQFASASLQEEGAFTTRRPTAFARLDALPPHADVLGTALDRPVFARLTYGAGTVYVHTVPMAFTNYAMLEGVGAEYAYRALAYLPRQPLWWDAYHKPLRVPSGSQLRYVVSNPPLRAAYYLALLTALLFVIFGGKRRQRVIPVVEPPRNDSLTFVQTLGRLFHQRGRHEQLASKRIDYFLDYLRTHLGLAVHTLDEARPEQVALRSGVDREAVEALFERARHARQATTLSERDVQALSQRLDRFYAAAQR